MKRVLSLLLHDVYRTHPSESGFAGVGADSYKLSIEELDVQLAGLAQVRQDLPILMTEEAQPGFGDVFFAITVDDGGLSYYTFMADRLEAFGWRGHCFVTTSAIGRPGFVDSRQIRELHARGHVIGSHSVSHPLRFSACSRESMVREWRQSRDVLEDIVGEDVTIASVPGGAFSARVASAAREAGLRTLFTSEPETRVGVIDGCMVLGRFTIRAGCRPDFAGRLGRLDPAARLKEWLLWNAKQRMKSVFALTAAQRYPEFLSSIPPS